MLFLAGFLGLVPADRHRQKPDMPGLGRHFALEPAEAERLARSGSDEVMAYVEAIEEEWDDTWTVDSDRAWVALHRCLTDGTLTFGGGPYPLSYAFLGGRLLTASAHALPTGPTGPGTGTATATSAATGTGIATGAAHDAGDGCDYIVTLVDPAQTREVAAALAALREAWLRERFFGPGLEPAARDDHRGSGGEPDFPYTWERFLDVRAFYARAAEAGRAVLFTADV
ncbi:DUF1877 family protein [Streptomyces sp. NPDC004838]